MMEGPSQSLPSFTYCCYCDVDRSFCPTQDEWDALLSCVWEEEARQRITRYHKGSRSTHDFDAKSHSDTKCFLIGRLIFQAAASVVYSRITQRAGSPLQFSRTAEGKPFVSPSYLQAAAASANTAISPDEATWNGNVSHAGTVVVFASEGSGRLVGVDVMPVEPVPIPDDFSLDGFDPNDTLGMSAEDRKRLLLSSQLRHDHVDDFFSYFGSYFTPVEWEWIQRGCYGKGIVNRDVKPLAPFRRLKRFFVNWTLKESYIKAVGIGLGLELQRAEFRLSRIDNASDVDVDSQHFFSSLFQEELSVVRSNSSSEPLFPFGGGQRCSDQQQQQMSCRNGEVHVTMHLDGVPRHDWEFTLFEILPSNSVGAIARGPLRDAVSPITMDIGEAAVSPWNLQGARISVERLKQWYTSRV